MKNEKSKLRKQILEKRDALPLESRQAKDRAIWARLIQTPPFIQAKNIFIYLGFGSEINTLAWLEDLYALGKNIYVPYVYTDENSQEKTMKMTPLTNPQSQLTPGFYGILEVKDEFLSFADPQILDLVLMPGVAFDPTMNRLGYGGGFYDRFLDQLAPNIPLIALAYDEQLVESIPVDPHDKLVDQIITDQRTL